MSLNRYGYGIWIGVGCALVTIVAGAAPPARSQEARREVSAGLDDPFVGWATLISRGFAFDPDAEQSENFKVTTSPEARFLAGEAMQQIERADFEEAVRTLQKLIDSYSSHLIEMEHSHFLGAGELARFLLRGLPPAGRAAYDRFVRRREETLLERAAVTARAADGGVGPRRAATAGGGARRAALADLVERYDLSTAGRSALLALAEWAFEEGRFVEAEAYLRRCLQTLAPADQLDLAPLRAVLVARLALAHRALGRPVLPLAALVTGDEPLEVAGESCDLAAFLRDSGDDTTLDRLAERDWPTFAGTQDRNGEARAPDELPDLDEPAYSLPIFDELADDIDPFEISRYLDREIIPPYQPVRVGDTLFVNNTLSVWAANLYSGDKIWTFDGPMTDVDSTQDTGLDRYRGIRPCPISNNYVAALTVEDGIVLANLMRPVPWPRVHRLDNHVINTPLPARSLVALRASDGKLLWRHDTLEGPGSELLSRLSIPSPPVVAGGVVVAFGYYREGGINAYLVMLDLATGRLLDSVPLCISQSELTMFGRPFREFTAAPLSLAQDCVYACTNLGLLAAVDLTTGWVRWMSAYPTIRIQPASNFFRPNPRRVVWANNPVIVDDDQIFIAPHDSDALSAFDRRTGRRLWSVRARGAGHGELRHLLGVRGGRVYVSGSQEVVAFDTRNGRPLWRHPFDRAEGQMPAGRGVLTETDLLIPTLGELQRLDRQTGALRSRSPWSAARQRNLTHQPGNTLVFTDLLVTAGAREVAVYLDVERALREVEARLDGERSAFADLLTAANLLCYERQYDRALDYYRQASEVARARDLPAAARAEVRQGIYRSSIELCRTLCPIDADGAFATLEQVRDVAETRQADMTACLSLLGDLVRTGARDRLLALIADLDQRYGGETWDQAPGGAVPVGLFLLMTEADLHQSTGRHAEEVAALQQAMQRFGDRGWNGRSVREAGFERIQERIRSVGRDIYAALDRQAEQMVREAVERDAPDALLYAIRAFPNAARIGHYVVRLGELLLAHERHADLFTELPSFLQKMPQAPERAEVLGLLERAADAVGNRRLVETIRGEARRGGSELPGAVPRAEASDPESGEEARSIEGRLMPRYLWETRGVRSRITESCGLDLGDRGALAVMVTSRNVLALDLRATGAEDAVLWERRSVGDPRESLPVPLALGESLVVATRRLLSGIDPLSGEEIWRRAFDPPVVVSTVDSGLIILVTDAREEELPCRLWAVEPATGAVLWSRDLGARWPTFLEVDGPVVGVPRRATRSLDLYAALTGTKLITSLPTSADIYAAPEIFASFGIVLTPARTRDGDRARSRSLWDTLVAYDLAAGDGETEAAPLWQRRGMQGTVRRRDIFRYRQAISVLYQPSTGEGPILWLLDPRSGEPLRERLQLPRGTEMIGLEDRETVTEPLLMAGLPPTASRYSAPWLKEPFMLSALDPAAADKPLWSVEIDLGRCQLWRRLESMRVGPVLLLLANVIPNGEQRCDTHLFVLDAGTGRELSHDLIRGSETWHKGVLQRAGSSVFVVKGSRRVAIYDLR